MQLPLPSIAKAASGDALLVPSSGLPVRAHSQQLASESSVLEPALLLAKAQAGEGELLRACPWVR